VTTHRLKSWPVNFRDVLTGRKRFEVRRDDRGFQPGDVVELLEFDPFDEHGRHGIEAGAARGYTGRTATYRIGYVSRGNGCPAGWCGFDLISLEDYNRVLMAIEPIIRGAR